MCPQTQCGARCWPAPGPLGSQALDLCTQVRNPSTAWFSPGRGRLVSRGPVGSPAVSGHCSLPARAWPCLWGSGGAGWAVCLAWILPSLPLLGVPGLGVWLSLAPVGLVPRVCPLCPGPAGGWGLGGAPFPSSLL